MITISDTARQIILDCMIDLYGGRFYVALAINGEESGERVPVFTTVALNTKGDISDTHVYLDRQIVLTAHADGVGEVRVYRDRHGGEWVFKSTDPSLGRLTKGDTVAFSL